MADTMTEVPSEYVKRLEDTVIFLAQTYLKAHDAMTQHEDAIIDFPIIQRASNWAALQQIADMQCDTSRGFRSLVEAMKARRAERENP